MLATLESPTWDYLNKRSVEQGEFCQKSTVSVITTIQWWFDPKFYVRLYAQQSLFIRLNNTQWWILLALSPKNAAIAFDKDAKFTQICLLHQGSIPYKTMTEKIIQHKMPCYCQTIIFQCCWSQIGHFDQDGHKKETWSCVPKALEFAYKRDHIHEWETKCQ